ncbi:MAG: hypothetical protein LDLANPLL_02162 [Turneriella sp.]|nr:hypothetical protein [Turneriella sp.]
MTRKLLEELENAENGSFELVEENGRAILKIFNPKGNGRPVHPVDLMNRIRSLKIVLDKNIAVDRILRNTQEGRVAEGQSHPIGTWPKVATRKAATGEVHVAPDQMSASIFIEPPEGGGEQLSKDAIVQLLKNHGVIKGLLDGVIADIAKKPQYKRLVVVAKGQNPKNGENGYIQPLFETIHKPRQTASKEKIDHKQVNLIRSAKAGEAIAEKINPTMGTPGYTVSAAILPAESGKIAEFQMGANVEISPDGKKLLSKIEGRPVLDSRGVIRVDEVVYLKNIDYSTGNVDFPGSVIVEDSIADGFKLHASGSIILQSSVGVCDISAGKDIILSAGFMGRGEGIIRSQGDVYVRFVEQGTIEAHGSIFISEASLHSKLIAGNSIIVKGGRGDITGGETVATNHVQCVKLGGAGEAKTLVTVGIDPAVRESIDRIKDSLKEKEATLEKIRISLTRLIDLAKKRSLDATETETREKLLLAQRKYRALVESDQKQLDTAQLALSAHSKAYVSVETQIYPNVEISFGRGLTYRSPVRTAIGRQVLFVEDRAIAIQPTLPHFLQTENE